MHKQQGELDFMLPSRR